MIPKYHSILRIKYSSSPKGEEMREVYYHGSRAQGYLDKAKAAAKDKELLAQISFMESRLAAETRTLTAEEQHKMDEMDWKEAQHFLFQREMSFYKPWATKYKPTAWFKEAGSICPVLGTYFGK